MENSWVKLYRKLGENKVMLDDKALRIFIWLLLHVNKRTGEYTTGRFWIARELNIKPGTVRDAIYRLRDKYEIIDTKSDNKKTIISLLNWAKYQQRLASDDTNDDITPTTSRQQADTKQELRIKNKEDITNVISKKEIPLQEILAYWNECRPVHACKSIAATRENVKFWLETYTLEEIKQAITNIDHDVFWKSKMTPMILFRQRNGNKERVDYIGGLLNKKNGNGYRPQYVKDGVLHPDSNGEINMTDL